MSHNHRKALRAFAQLAGRYGFTLDRITAKGHLKWVHPRGGIVITSAALEANVASRELKNAERNFKRVAQ